MEKFPHRIFLSPPNLNGFEIDYVKNAFNSNWIAPVGPAINEFENKMKSFLNRKFAVAVSSGTAALHLALDVLGVEEGDFVFCSDFTFVASANAIKYVNAIPIFIDSNLTSWNMCPKSLEKAFESYSPKAVIITDIYGLSAEYNELIKICDKHNTPIIEDSAESLGAEYSGKKCGSFGDISILSFNGNKIITTSSGGMILSDNEYYVNKAKKLSTQSKENEIHYEHLELGYNYRMSNILASIGIAQMLSIDKYVKKRRKVYSNYKNYLKSLKNVKFVPRLINGKSTNWLSTVLITNKSYSTIKDLIKKFNNLNVECRPFWKPMHLQPLYKSSDFFHIKKKPVSEYLFAHGLCLPSDPYLKIEDQKKICNFLIDCLN